MTTTAILPEAIENRAAGLTAGLQVCTPEPPDHRVNIFRMKSFRIGEIVDSVKSRLQQGNLEVSDCTCSLGLFHGIFSGDVSLCVSDILAKKPVEVKEFFCKLSSTPGERVKEAREKAGLKPIDLARKMGMDSGSLSNYESGKRPMGTKVAGRFAKALNVEAGWILYGIGKGPGEKSDQDRTAVEVVQDRWAWWDMAEVEGPYPTTILEALQDPATRAALQDPEIGEFLRRYARLDPEERRWILRQIEDRELIKELREGKGREELKTLLEKKTES